MALEVRLGKGEELLEMSTKLVCKQILMAMNVGGFF